MNEKYKEPNPEEPKSQREKDDEEYEQYIKDHPQILTTPEDLRECGPEIAEAEYIKKGNEYFS